MTVTPSAVQASADPAPLPPLPPPPPMLRRPCWEPDRLAGCSSVGGAGFRFFLGAMERGTAALRRVANWARALRGDGLLAVEAIECRYDATYAGAMHASAQAQGRAGRKTVASWTAGCSELTCTKRFKLTQFDKLHRRHAAAGSGTAQLKRGGSQPLQALCERGGTRRYFSRMSQPRSDRAEAVHSLQHFAAAPAAAAATADDAPPQCLLRSPIPAVH